MSSIKLIKDEIKTQLDQLVTAGTIQGCAEMDMRKDPLMGDIPNTPYAYIMPPSTESQTVDNRTLLRSYTFDIMFVVKGENVNTATYIEDLLEAVLNKFDNNPTLSGVADGGVWPATSTPQPLQHKNGSMIVFFVSLKIDKTQTLTY